MLTLANTGEVLRLENRSGSRPSHEGAAVRFDQCIALCREAGFRRIVLWGDTDFSQTQHLDRWHEQGGVRFVFGYDVRILGPRLDHRAVGVDPCLVDRDGDVHAFDTDVAHVLGDVCRFRWAGSMPCAWRILPTD